MRNFLFILATAAIVASCSQTDSLKESYTPEEEIGFSTFTSKQTRGETIDEASENNGSTTVNVLENYNTTFKVWGSKFIGSSNTESRVFGTDGTGDVVTYESSNWTYSPKRFWDKSATSYSFYAAAPSGQSWTWNNSTKKLSLSNFVVSGTNRVTTVHGTGTSVFGVNTSVSADAVMSKDIEDLMISNDVTGYNTYTNTPVSLHFNHILSRLNIGVRKSSDLSTYTVKLKSIKVYNMAKQGNFNEGADLDGGNGVTYKNDQNEDVNLTGDAADAYILQHGTIGRWTASVPNTDGVSYVNNDGLVVSSTTDYQYVYQGLVIPQAVAYNPTVEVNEYDNTVTNPAQFRLDGTDATASANPYIIIEYGIGQTADNTYTELDSYKYYYNLADVFNGDATTAVNFCEGWQNTLKITLAPVAITFDADVYEWETKENVAVNVPEN